jgi:ATP-dependent Clp endopeptidase proteolytic subunit ClpP
MKSSWVFKIRAASERLEIDLYDDIGKDESLFGMGGGISAADVLNQLKTAPKAKEVLVRINSAGGIVTDGLAIYNLLRHGTANVTCRVDGLAGSIASVIAMAGTLEMAEHSFLMIHNPWGIVKGASSELRTAADRMDQMRDEMLSIYCAKSGKSREFIGTLMDEETWLTGTEALAYGLCDRLISDSNVKLAAHFDLSAFTRTPRDVESLIAASATAAVGDSVVAVSQPPESPGAPVADASTEELTITETPAAKAADSGANTMDEQVYKDQIAALEATVAELKAALETEKSARAAAESEAIEAKAKFPKKGEDDEDEDDEEEMAKAAVVAACVTMTGCKDLKKLAGAVLGHADKLTTKHASQTVAQRVTALIQSGQLRPDRKAMALKLTHDGLDGYLEMTGGAKFGPVGTEHEPNDSDPAVVAARAAAKPPAFDPDTVVLDAAERAVVKQMGANDPGLAERMLTEKRAQAKAEYAKKFGGSAAA